MEVKLPISSPPTNIQSQLRCLAALLVVFEVKVLRYVSTVIQGTRDTWPPHYCCKSSPKRHEVINSFNFFAHSHRFSFSSPQCYVMAHVMAQSCSLSRTQHDYTRPWRAPRNARRNDSLRCIGQLQLLITCRTSVKSRFS